MPSNPSQDYYFIHRDTGRNTEPVIVEYGFLDSTLDDPTQIKNNYKNYAEAVVNAVLDYIGYGGSTYIVKSGDSLYSIANKFNTTVDKLKSFNNLSSNTLSIGQVLNIPGMEAIEKPIEGNNVYVVKSGDSLYSIASRYNTTVDTLKRLNNLTNNLLSVGQILILPSTNIVDEPIDNTSTYRVVSGDTLYSIARKYNTTVSNLIDLNNLTNTGLSVGQILIVPGENSDIIYVVKSGDSLWSIAKKYNTTVADIKTKNNLTSNLLSIGQKLTI